jgi:chromate transport protein ChrA
MKQLQVISTSRSTCALPNMAAFCSSLVSFFAAMLRRYLLKHFEIVSVARVISAVTFIIIIIIIIIVIELVPIHHLRNKPRRCVWA